MSGSGGEAGGVKNEPTSNIQRPRPRGQAISLLVCVIVFLALWLAPVVVVDHMGEERDMGSLGLLLGIFLGRLGVAAISILAGGGEASRQRHVAEGTHFVCPWWHKPGRTGAVVCPHCRRFSAGSAR